MITTLRFSIVSLFVVANCLLCASLSLAAIPDNNSVTTIKIVNGAVTSAKIRNHSIKAADLASNSIKTSKILNGAVTSAKIRNYSIMNNDIASGAIVSDKIADGHVRTADLASGVVTYEKMANDSVKAQNIKDGEVKKNDIGSQQVEGKNGSGSEHVLSNSIIGHICSGGFGPDCPQQLAGKASDIMEKSIIGHGHVSGYTSDISAGTINSTDITDNSLTGSDIDETTLSISVENSDIADSAISASKLTDALRVNTISVNTQLLSCIDSYGNPTLQNGCYAEGAHQRNEAPIHIPPVNISEGQNAEIVRITFTSQDYLHSIVEDRIDLYHNCVKDGLGFQIAARHELIADGNLPNMRNMGYVPGRVFTSTDPDFYPDLGGNACSLGENDLLFLRKTQMREQEPTIIILDLHSFLVTIDWMVSEI
ncbi:hypothetical protein ACFL2D_02035 [Patescibacteria group bacterium]